MLIYIELMTHGQARDVLDILRFPDLRGDLYSSKVVEECRGRKTTKRPTSLTGYLPKAQNRKYNSILVERLPKLACEMEVGPSVRGVTQHLYISATHPLWASSEQVISAKDWKVLHSLKQAEDIVKNTGIVDFPCFSQTFISLQGTEAISDATEWFSKELNKLIPDIEAFNCVIGGWGIVHNLIELSNSSLNSLYRLMMNDPKAIKYIGEKFPALYPNLIGSIELCHNLIESQDQGIDVVEIKKNKYSLGHINFPQDLYMNEVFRQNIQPYFATAFGTSSTDS